MRLFFVSIALLTALALGILATPADAQTFNANLTIGSRGADVVSLQQFLVARGFLQMPLAVAYGYFGPLTRAAVARWQTANGITPPAGFFGPISRAAIASQINPIATSSITPANSTPPMSALVPRELFPNVEIDTPVAPGMRAGQVMLFRAFPFEVRPGDVISLDGSGFSKTLNKIYFNGGNPVIATSTDGITLDVPVPLTLSESEYRLAVSNVLGFSNNPDIAVVIKVTNNPQAEPAIESASIAGDVVTLVGTGFTSANNLITTFGNSPRSITASDGTITFHITELSMYNEIRKFTFGNYQTVFWIYVQNEHGVNKEPYKLEITI
ncbi:MAG: peptidoglycan-binding protein [Candidatus Zambryskibacteria bacterium]|nr:peptidoglycan-binding protein [Candidatus Zambryskibacteria bacterium]